MVYSDKVVENLGVHFLYVLMEQSKIWSVNLCSFSSLCSKDGVNCCFFFLIKSFSLNKEITQKWLSDCEYFSSNTIFRTNKISSQSLSPLGTCLYTCIPNPSRALATTSRGCYSIFMQSFILFSKPTHY